MAVQKVLVQAIGFCGTILFFLSFQCRSNRRLFRMQLVSYVFYTLHLFFLGAYTGAFSYIINCLRSYCLGSKWRFGNSKYMCCIICAMQLALLFFTWSGWISLLPVAANIASTLGGYTHNPKKIRLSVFFINSPLWIVYNIIVGSWAGLLDEIVSETSIIISVLRFGWNKLDRTE